VRVHVERARSSVGLRREVVAVAVVVEEEEGARVVANG
jgi:hypothetical protein